VYFFVDHIVICIPGHGLGCHMSEDDDDVLQVRFTVQTRVYPKTKQQCLSIYSYIRVLVLFLCVSDDNV
jgi:hypothetical protein